MSCFFVQGIMNITSVNNFDFLGGWVLDEYCKQECIVTLQRIFAKHKEISLSPGDSVYLFAKVCDICMEESGTVDTTATIRSLQKLQKCDNSQMSLMFFGTGFVSYIKELHTTQSGRVYMDYGFSSTFYQKKKKASEKIYLKPRIWGISAEKFSKKIGDRIEVVADVKSFSKFISRDGMAMHSIALNTPLLDKTLVEFADRSAEDTPTAETVHTPIQQPPPRGDIPF